MEASNSSPKSRRFLQISLGTGLVLPALKSALAFRAISTILGVASCEAPSVGTSGFGQIVASTNGSGARITLPLSVTLSSVIYLYHTLSVYHF